LSNWLTGILPNKAARLPKTKLAGKFSAGLRLGRSSAGVFISFFERHKRWTVNTSQCALPDAPKKDPRTAAGIFRKLLLPTHLNPPNQILARRLRIMNSPASLFLSAIIMPMEGAKIRC
jgi:hypothetical protein